MMIINLTQHVATWDQIAAGVVEHSPTLECLLEEKANQHVKCRNTRLNVFFERDRRRRVAERIEKFRFLSFDELRRLMAVIERKRDKALFLIAYSYGLHASEVGRLWRDNLDQKQMQTTLRRLKGSLGGVHPMQRTRSDC
jgi:integrase